MIDDRYEFDTVKARIGVESVVLYEGYVFIREKKGLEALCIAAGVSFFFSKKIFFGPCIFV